MAGLQHVCEEVLLPPFAHGGAAVAGPIGGPFAHIVGVKEDGVYPISLVPLGKHPSQFLAG